MPKLLASKYQHPKNWRDAANALQVMAKKAASRKSNLMDRLDKLEQLVKERSK